MSSTTPNIGLTKVDRAGGETVGQWSDANNGSGGNLDIIDTKMGAVGNTSLQAQINTLNSKIKLIQLTKTTSSGYFGILPSEIPFGKKLLVQNVYISNNNLADITFAVQANASGNTYSYYVYVRRGSSNPPDNTSVTVNIFVSD